MESFADEYIDIRCADYAEYQEAAQGLERQGYSFIGNHDVRLLAYEIQLSAEQQEVHPAVHSARAAIGVEIKKESANPRVLEAKKGHNFRNLVDELMWDLTDGGVEFKRLPGYTITGVRVEDLVAFYVKESPKQ